MTFFIEYLPKNSSKKISSLVYQAQSYDLLKVNEVQCTYTALLYILVSVLLGQLHSVI